MQVLEPTAPTRRSHRRGIADLGDAYAAGTVSPEQVARDVLDQIEARGKDGTWISVATQQSLLAHAAGLGDPDGRPLFGVPFAVKDSIDIAGWPTTLACPDYAYEARATAPAITRLLDAGALLVGKTNLDQFATGLNGTRTPYGIPRSVYGGELISGGSSSGSALAVAHGDVPFAVATDTAGSGRVPAALNGIVGFKPSRGLISAVGLVPACRSLDCLSLMARTVEDVRTVFRLIAAPDPADPWSRERGPLAQRHNSIRVGLPDVGDLEFFGDTAMATAHRAARQIISTAYPTPAVPLRPFLEAGELLYSGPWVAERLLEFGDFLDTHPGAALPVVEQIIRGGARFRATDVFRAQYRLAALKAEVGRLFTAVDVLVVPTIGTTFTVEEVLADPIATNTALGHYTHFGNLLDLCGVAIPAGTTTDRRPVSVMVLGPALSDETVLAVAERLAGLFPQPD